MEMDIQRSQSRRVFRRVQDLVSMTLNSREFLVG